MTTQTDTKPQIDLFRYGWRDVMQPDEAGRMQWVQIPLTLEDVLHPQEEDRLAQNEYHEEDCTYLKNALTVAMNGREDAAVFHDRRVDWGVEGVKPLGPDLVVWVNMPRTWDRSAGTFYPAQCGARAILVLEVTSPTTRNVDLDTKVKLYQKVGVPLYVLVDSWPEEEERHVRVFGYRSTSEGYVRLHADDEERLWVEPVKLWLVGGGTNVVCLDEHGQRIPDYKSAVKEVKQVEARAEELQQLTEEAITARQQAEKRAKDEAQRASELATRLADMEAELRRLRGQ